MPGWRNMGGTRDDFREQDIYVYESEDDSQQEPTEVTFWWKSLEDLLKGCFTPTRVMLEVPTNDVQSVRSWAISSTADILSFGDSNCIKLLIGFFAQDPLGIRIFLQIMTVAEPEAESLKRRELASKVLREIVNPKNGKIRRAVVQQGIAARYLQVSIFVLQDLMQRRSASKLADEMDKLDSTLVNFLWFVSALATNDSSFSESVRELLKVKFFHAEVFKKIFFAKSSAHYPLLKILRQLTRNEQTAKILGREGVMSTIRKGLTILGSAPCGKVLIVLDMLNQLTKLKNNCVRLQRAGLVVKLMQIFQNWELWRGKGLLRLSKFLTSIYAHVARIKSGRKTIIKCDAIFQLRKFCDLCPPERAFDDIMTRVAGLVATCYRKEKLPLETLESPLKFNIPQVVDRKLLESGSSSDDEGSDADVASDKNSDDSGQDDVDDADVEDDLDNDDEDDKQGQAPLPSADNSSDEDEEDDNNCYEKILPSTSTTKLHQISQSKSKHSMSGGDHLGLNSKEVDACVSEISKLRSYHRCFPELEKTESGVFLQRISSDRCIPKSLSLEDLIDENSNETKILKLPKSEFKYSWIEEEEEVGSRHMYWTSIEEVRQDYALVANAVNHVAPFVKIAYPDFVLGQSAKTTEQMLANVDRSLLRSKIAAYMTKIICGDPFKPKVVYNLDDLVKSSPNAPNRLGNNDEKKLGINRNFGLLFESRFECGNLRRAIQVGEREYDLMITSDVNSSHHNQWFYFQVSNTLNDKPYTFNIINCTKSNSLFNYGMQPVCFSVTDALRGKPGWVRSGFAICYFRNGYKYESKKRALSRSYHTLCFSINFQHKGDVCYIAYHMPYPYSRLMVELNAMLRAVGDRDDITVKHDVLCKSLNQNDVPVLTVTAPVKDQTPNDREIILLTSRVHPGETNSSWVMKGVLEFLLFGSSFYVKALLEKYIFKIVPMLNVEGVINGCHRCGLTSEDLNRCWKSPSEILHPSIYHTKMLIQYSQSQFKMLPTVFCDIHGHSRRKNIFFYGCTFAKSWNPKDRTVQDDTQLLHSLPKSMERVSSAFCLPYCHYDVKKSRETTARVAVWRDYAIVRSYTLECSYSGCDRGELKGIALSTSHLLEIGRDLCKACLDM